jgi:ClpP class serine protease
VAAAPEELAAIDPSSGPSTRVLFVPRHPVRGFIDIDDSEAVIRAIEMTGKKVRIDLVLHNPGGLVLAAGQIASALADHPAQVTVYVPHYAMSGATLISLAADQIVMAPSAVLGPVDPQLGAPLTIPAVAGRVANGIIHSGP